MQMLWGVGPSRFLLKLGNTGKNYTSYLVLTQDRKKNHPRENITFDTIMGVVRQCFGQSPQREETPHPHQRCSPRTHLSRICLHWLHLLIEVFFLLETSLHNLCGSIDTLGSLGPSSTKMYFVRLFNLWMMCISLNWAFCFYDRTIPSVVISAMGAEHFVWHS